MGGGADSLPAGGRFPGGDPQGNSGGGQETCCPPPVYATGCVYNIWFFGAGYTLFVTWQNRRCIILSVGAHTAVEYPLSSWDPFSFSFVEHAYMQQSLKQSSSEPLLFTNLVVWTVTV